VNLVVFVVVVVVIFDTNAPSSYFFIFIVVHMLGVSCVSQMVPSICLHLFAFVAPFPFFLSVSASVFFFL
jgi:hypothetical protein